MGFVGSDAWITRYLSGCVVLAFREIACRALAARRKHYRALVLRWAIVDLHLVAPLQDIATVWLPGCRCAALPLPGSCSVSQRQPATQDVVDYAVEHFGAALAR